MRLNKKIKNNESKWFGKMLKNYWKDEFLIKTNSFFVVNKELDLVKNRLIKFNKKERKVTITNNGHIFIKDLLKLNILED